MTQYPIVGAYFRPPAKAILEVLQSGCPLTLTPEPDNQYDSNAIRITVLTTQIPESEHERLGELVSGHGMELSEVLAQAEWQLGYVPRGLAEDLAPQLNGASASATLGWDIKGNPVAQVD